MRTADLTPEEREILTGGRPHRDTVQNTLVRMGDEHHALIDLILMYPGLKDEVYAKQLGRSRSWVGVVRSSDLFRMELSLRRAAMEDGIKEVVKQKTDTAIRAGLDRMIEALGEEDVDPRYALDAVDKMMKHRFGTGASGGSAAAVQVNVGVTGNDLQSAQQIMREHARSGRIFEAIREDLGDSVDV